ncbi:amino acid permease [Lacticaseibacillus pantheris]
MQSTEKNNVHMARDLKNRHVQLIALGGTIGTGLFLGAGQTIHQAGPAILLAYIVTGLVCFLMMRALGELLLSDTTKHNFIDFISEYLGVKTGKVIGWVYWVCWIAVAIAEITAVGLYVKYWIPGSPQWVSGLITLVLLLCLNLISVGAFGETEFWFALIKVVAIVILIVVGLVLIFLHVKTREGNASFSNLTAFGGFFAQGAGGFFSSFQMVVFSFVGIEMVGLTASETADPHHVIPKAINEIPVRVIIFYVGALLVIMSVFPWSAVSTSSSPFVQVFDNAGISAGGDIINFVVLVAAASACNSSLYSTGRLLFGMGVTGKHPVLRYFGRLNHRQVPARAIAASAGMIALGVILNIIIPASIFTAASSAATTCFLFVWGALVLTHLRYRRANPQGHEFRLPGAPFTDYLVLAFLIMVFVVMAWLPSTRAALIVAVAFVLVVCVLTGVWRRDRHVE